MWTYNKRQDEIRIALEGWELSPNALERLVGMSVMLKMNGHDKAARDTIEDVSTISNMTIEEVTNVVDDLVYRERK